MKVAIVTAVASAAIIIEDHLVALLMIVSARAVYEHLRK